MGTIMHNDIEYGGGGGYELPIASANELGGIKVGSGLSIDNNGILSTIGGSSGIEEVELNTNVFDFSANTPSQGRCDKTTTTTLTIGEILSKYSALIYVIGRFNNSSINYPEYTQHSYFISLGDYDFSSVNPPTRLYILNKIEQGRDVASGLDNQELNEVINNQKSNILWFRYSDASSVMSEHLNVDMYYQKYTLVLISFYDTSSNSHTLYSQKNATSFDSGDVYSIHLYGVLK